MYLTCFQRLVAKMQKYWFSDGCEHVLPDQKELLDNVGRYKRLVKKLNFLTVTRSNITFTISVVSQPLSAPRTTHLEIVMRILRYLKKSPGRGVLYSDQIQPSSGFSDADWAWYPFDMRSTTRYRIFLGENLVSWKNKKQSVVSQSSAESEYRAMANVTLELIWNKFIDKDWFFLKCFMRLYGDNKATIHIVKNNVFHEKTKYIEVDCHIVCKKLEVNIIVVKHIASGRQLAYLLTKWLDRTRIDFICDKLGMYDDIYSNLRGSVERDIVYWV